MARKSIKEFDLNQSVKVWFKEERNRIYVISGYAGCGKTTFAKKVPEILGVSRFAFLAPTGKAARVLHKTAQTIHSYMYDVFEDEFTGKLQFQRKPIASFLDQILIVDEISMVNEELLADLQSLRIPIIGLGDPAQLPPVHGNNTILDTPDIFLKKVYRNSGGILMLSKDIREQRKVKTKYENVYFRKELFNDLNLINDETIIICRFNKTRQKINRMIRDRVKGFKESLEVGDKLINLVNNRDSGLMNGSIVEILIIYKIDHLNDIATILVQGDEYKQVIEIDLDIVLGIEEKPKRYRKFNKDGEAVHEVDYAYAITCHKSQGSEFQRVLVINQGQRFDDHAKWLYTAITRAQKELYIYN